MDSVTATLSTVAFPPAANRAKEKASSLGAPRMQRLILMRHGEAERPAPALKDFDRALDAEGREESRRIGRALAKAGLGPDLILVSGARRTAQTGEAVAEAFAGVTVEADDGLYEASPARLAEAVRDAAPRATALMLIGHNPSIHLYALQLARQAGASTSGVRSPFDSFPTGTAAVFALQPERRPAFERLFLARDYRTDAP